jgi:hypothetical protein
MSEADDRGARVEVVEELRRHLAWLEDAGVREVPRPGAFRMATEPPAAPSPVSRIHGAAGATPTSTPTPTSTSTANPTATANPTSTPTPTPTGDRDRDE